MAGPRSPSPLERPSWCPGWMHPLEAAQEQEIINPIITCTDYRQPKCQMTIHISPPLDSNCPIIATITMALDLVTCWWLTTGQHKTPTVLNSTGNYTGGPNQTLKHANFGPQALLWAALLYTKSLDGCVFLNQKYKAKVQKWMKQCEFCFTASCKC